MIIRKPYAFLIKHFKLIHIGIFLIFCYLLLSLRDLYQFFKGVILNNNYSGGVGLESKYTSFLLLLAILLLIFLAFSIFFLMKKKNKPVLFYKIIMGYGAFLLVFYFIYRGYFTSVDTTTYSPRSLVLFRDSSVIIYLAAYAFVGFSFVRAFGFDIKKFSFEKDKKELNISSSDNEEVELNFNLDKDKILNTVRKERRQFKYFVEDNKVVLKKIGYVLCGILAVFLLYTFFVTNKTYKMGEWIYLDYIDSSIKIDRVYLTNLNPYQKTYGTKSKYVGVLFDLNVGGYSFTYGNSMLRLTINGDYYFPVQNATSLLSDMGSYVISGDKFPANKEYIDRVVVFAYDKDIKVRDVSLEIYMNDGKYHKIKTNYMEQGNSKTGYEEIEFKYGEEIPLLDGITINSSKIHKGTISYKLPDKNCNGDNCQTYTKRIQPDINDNILELDLKYTDNKENNAKLEYYLSIFYELDGKIYIDNAESVKILDHVNIDGEQKLYLSINSDILSASKKYLLITTRDVKYKLLLTNSEDEIDKKEENVVETEEESNNSKDDYSNVINDDKNFVSNED